MTYRLYCKGKDLPVKYLGIPIGGSHRRIAMWRPLMEFVKKKLAPWKGHHLSFGGRITLINSVLSSLPVFLMSFYLLPKGVIHFIDKIRKSFLWGGEGEGRKINWVKWEKVCKNKHYGGLGVRGLRKFNFALMGKWWGRLARKEQGLWDKVIASKYGRSGGHWLDWVREGRGIGSLWWRDVCCLNNVDEENEGWLTEGFKLKLGEGKGVSFWWDNWGGEGCLANLFPRLYSLSTGKEKECYQMGKEENGTWKWVAKWLWKACGKWWGISVNLEIDCWKSYEQFGVWAKEARVKEGWDCIWNVVVWSVWLTRNQKIFQDSDVNIRSRVLSNAWMD
ncbi:hypothetical protein SLEP1_g20531 [Rubroshorea leprosula]|uniref:Uncharacterized protein n=1 Tax=Rubroshorea leprosula TaxID=152421 RepID=A0AAV5JC73_9ROSI|nr:hypothetical protein SLEP1_g20531 [Rubroshorea leprosula]